MRSSFTVGAACMPPTRMIQAPLLDQGLHLRLQDVVATWRPQGEYRHALALGAMHTGYEAPGLVRFGLTGLISAQ